MDSKFNMFFFGCWNRDGCMIENSPLNRVVESIISNADKKYEIGIIAGDNSYPKTETIRTGPSADKIKYKTHYPQIINGGIECIRKTIEPTQLWSIVGNHDIEMNRNGECVALLTQLENNQIVNNFYTKTYKNSFFIFIDTNIFPGVHFGKKVPECYKNINIFINTDTDVKTFFNQCVSACEAGQFDHIFIIGHDPMITVKKKTGIQSNRPHLYIEWMMETFQHFNATINYLCADTHNYQSATINRTNPINHIISGTGGAKLDTIDHDIIEWHGTTKNGTSYQINDIRVEYGYTEISIDGKDIQFKFIPNASTYDDEPTYQNKIKELYAVLESKAADSAGVGSVGLGSGGVGSGGVDPIQPDPIDMTIRRTMDWADRSLYLNTRYKTLKTKYTDLSRSMRNRATP